MKNSEFGNFLILITRVRLMKLLAVRVIFTGPFDDFVGATKTFFDFYLNVQCFAQMFEVPDKINHFYTFADAFIRRVNPINIENLHRIYFKAVKLLWKTCNKNPKEPSIINAKRILTTPSFIKKLTIYSYYINKFIYFCQYDYDSNYTFKMYK
jgi:hypothetical protein